MQHPIIKTPEEIREILLAQGLNPERYRKFLEVAVKTQHDNFIAVASLLPPEERIEMELNLMQGELSLAIVSRCSY